MLFGSSGIRRRYDDTLIGIALQAGKAVGAKAGLVTIGRDTRTTSPLISAAFSAGVLAAGARVYDGGIAPTPSIAYSGRNADTACMITASHNPEPYNGLKLFNPDGSSFSATQQQEIEESLADIPWSDGKKQGIITPSYPVEEHSNAIANKIQIKEGLKVIVDCGNGAGSVITPHLLSRMSAKTFAVNANIAGNFTRPSEPLPEHLPYIPSLITRTGSACAIIHDGDADRMMAFDQNGKFIPGDTLLILFAKYLGAKQVVTTYDASMAIEEVAEVRRTPVGDAFVSEQLVRWGDFGGEPSGAWIFPQISRCPDGPYAAALLCEIAGEWDLSSEIASIPGYPILRKSLELENTHDLLYALGAVNPTDGIRIEEEEGWCLIRASGTERKIRFTAEGKSMDIAKRLLRKGEDMIRIIRKEVKL
ncbi:phosphopentomutase/phosphoglucosamine mutase [Methanospirillum sp.]|uniref:phosphopentomutase/phosphoglucosamine mutase n=1 Tax=Methanospirillum sp. TaxID=45200 RepID=UPI002986572F|nr:phosphopentomutase/phosphoglucosamine mutase [Methanospirillum sp.]